MYFLPEDLSVFQTGVSSSEGHQYDQGLPVSLHLPCKERMENWGFFSLGEEAVLRDDEGPGCPLVCVRRSRRKTQTLHRMHGRRKSDNRQKLRKQEFRLAGRENNSTVAQRGCDVPVLARFQELTG